MGERGREGIAEPEETCVFEHETSIPGLLTLHRDGTITRLEIPQGELDVPPSTNSKDLVLLTAPHVKARLFLPTESPSKSIKLPLILFFHGGGFVSLSYASPGCHSLCNELALKTHAIVVSVGYRLAPEHRLPAAFEDGFSALLWLKGQALCEPNCEPWLASYADFTKVFIAGVSAGASIVHQVALQAAAVDLKPELDLRGLVLVVPFLGGQVRTQSEVELEGSSTLPLQGCDKCWALSLPIGATRDHPFSNVMGAHGPRVDDSMAWPPSLLVLGGRDILHDRQLAYAQQLQEAGKAVTVATFEHGDHFMSGHFHDLMVEEITTFVLNHSS